MSYPLLLPQGTEILLQVFSSKIVFAIHLAPPIWKQWKNHFNFLIDTKSSAQCTHGKSNDISNPRNQAFIGWKGMTKGFQKYFC